MSDIEFDNEAQILKIVEDFCNPERLKKALGKGCAAVEREAKIKAPKGTGELRRSITSEVKEEGKELVGIVFTPLEYAPYVEYGTGLFAEAGNGRKDVPWSYQDAKGEWHSTSGMKPQPYLRPALLSQKKAVVKTIAKEGINQ